MHSTEQPKDMRDHNAWGLFSMKPVPDGFVVLVHDVPIVGPVSFAAAHELFIRLIKQTVCLDGNARALAVVWARAADECENARHVQARCTELIDETRGVKAKLKIARDLLYRAKFALEQGATDALDRHNGVLRGDPYEVAKLAEDIIDVLDKTAT
jgi:hypothetical protein